MDSCLNDDAIGEILLEEIPEDNGGWTDIENDDYDDENSYSPETNNFDSIFEQGLEDFVNNSNEPLDNADDDMTAPTCSPGTLSSKNTTIPVEPSCSSSSRQALVPKQSLSKKGNTKLNKQKRKVAANEREKKECKKPKKDSTVEKDNRHWKKKETETQDPPYSGKLPGPVQCVFEGGKTPTKIFIKTIEPIIEPIVYQSNLYAVQRGKTLALERNELLAFIGINFFMGYNIQPAWKHYWSTSSDLGSDLVSNTMSRNRFDSILNNLHINDNHLRPDDCKDKLYKMRPLITKMNEQFIHIYNVNRHVAVDESIILFKGRSSMKQYNPMKPIKRGYKLWCLADSLGYTSQFEIYQGKFGENDENYGNQFGMSEKVVLRLTEPYWGTHVKVFIDNFYTSIAVLEKLKAENTLACGTIRSHRKGLPDLLPDRALSRGDFDFRVSNLNISVYKWMDNKAVYLASNYHGSEQTTVKRTVRDGSKIDVKCPTVVRDYNTYMGGVDCADQLRQYYGVNRRSRKWWHRLWWGIIEIAFVNSYIIYKNLNPNEKSSLLDYRRAVAQGLMAKNKQYKRKSSTQPKKGANTFSVPKDVRLSNLGAHFPEFSTKRGRCELCSSKKVESRPYSKCEMCHVYLCLNDKKNCFKLYHTM